MNKISVPFQQFCIFAKKYNPMKRSILILFLALTCQIFSQNVSQEEAIKVAKIISNQIESQSITLEKVESKDAQPLLYIFNFDKGFVAVAGDKNSQPILAYSETSRYDAQNPTAPAQMWLDYYAGQIASIKEQKYSSPDSQRAWDELLNGKKTFDVTPIVAPLMTSRWGQESKYNFYCPTGLGGPNGHAVTGCVATAMAQLIYYFRFPEMGVGSYSYEHPDYGTISADFSAAHYDYDAMCDEPAQINTAISLLNFHCGVAVDMNYGPDGSGMWNHSAARALRNYFKFAPETEYLFRDSTNINWDSTIVSHLQRNIPMYYAGWSDTLYVTGHGFIVDGYAQPDSCYFHFNFGWEGSMDGYYYTRALNPGSNFNLLQELIINAVPDGEQYEYPTPVTQGETAFLHGVGSFTDGSGPFQNMENNVNYTWTIRPEIDIDSITALELKLMYDLAENDAITIDGEGFYHYFTNDSATFTLSESVKELNVTLTTGSGATGSGIKANWNAVLPSYCKTSQYTQPEGSIGDGSGDYRYNNLTSCNKMIYVKNAASITLRFTRFETEADKDFLRIYTRQDQHTPVHELSGTLEQDSYTYNTDGLILKFTTDEANVFDGYELEYYADMTGVDEICSHEVGIMPNPASEQVSVVCDEAIRRVACYDLNGRRLFESQHDSANVGIDISALRPGIYFFQIETDSSVQMKKVIVANE